jgi:hypothetical protein
MLPYLARLCRDSFRWWHRFSTCASQLEKLCHLIAITVGMAQLKRLRGCEFHMTHIPTPGDDAGLRRLGVNLTCDPQFATNNLFVG